ncbi:MAG: zinc-binding dehydrogenase [Rhodobacteraceae bacterium]|nr:zinc-binding dehydrogenase [Paracoccaceae bacterium]
MTLPTTMTGIYLTRHGGPDALELRHDIPVPIPGKGEVLVEVMAAGVNNTDINTRIGWYSSDVTGATEDVATDAGIESGGHAGALHFPRIQGGDLCGRIVALGPDVEGWSLGQRVTGPINLPRPTDGSPMHYIALGSEVDGAFAQYCLVQAVDIYDVTSSPLSDEEIAAIPCAFGTAENLLNRAGLCDGQSVLITGASGGVGLAAVQLAAIRGARVTAMTAPTKADAVRQAGASETIARDASLPLDHFDVVIDVVAGPIWPALIDALKPGGHYATSGAIAGPNVDMDLRRIYLRDITIHGATYQSPEVFARLVSLMKAGTLRPLISKTYPLEQIADAQAEFERKRLPGKLVLIPPKATL